MGWEALFFASRLQKIRWPHLRKHSFCGPTFSIGLKCSFLLSGRRRFDVVQWWSEEHEDVACTFCLCQFTYIFLSEISALLRISWVQMHYMYVYIYIYLWIVLCVWASSKVLISVQFTWYPRALHSPPPHSHSHSHSPECCVRACMCVQQQRNCLLKCAF